MFASSMSHTSTRCKRRCGRRWWAGLLVAVLITSNVSDVWAAPLTRRQQEVSNSPGPDQTPGGISPQVWVPALVVVLALLAAFCFVWTRTSVRERLRGMASRATQSGNTTGAREVTASQLVGGNNAGANGRSGTAARPTRTPRRTRRTPSQMSTTSLPAYMKEPGDQELVIFRGPEEMDASDAIAEAREAEDQEDEHDSVGLHEPNNYGPAPMASMPTSVQSLSFAASAMNLTENGNANASMAELIPRPGEANHERGSQDTSDSRSLLMRRTSDVPSEAPPDYETERHSTTINPPGLVDSPEPPTTPPPIATSLPATPESPRYARRRSRLASRVSNILHLRNNSSSSSAPYLRTGQSGVMTPELPDVARTSNVSAEAAPNPAAASYVTLNDPPASPTRLPGAPPSSGVQHSRHRSSQSGGSGSTLGLGLPFRTLSRQRSNNTLNSGLGHHAGASRSNLTSPSALSLSLAAGAISSPLSHTLVRTEIRYPRGGPTAEQIKLISSRESLGRFGVPYGRDAIEHAQHSRHELALDPPPVFESPTTEEGPSAARGEAESTPDGLPQTTGAPPDANDPSVSSEVGQSHSVEGLPPQDSHPESPAAAFDPPHIHVPLFM
ncbi:hypothetical protein M0805_004069 [Coniferiporia weirii]|nr:hypothetical protein M0805_004069 [Coniferiporia weirii]